MVRGAILVCFGIQCLSLVNFTDAVKCSVCVNVNGACAQFEDCGNSYCLYEYIRTPSTNAVAIRKSCQNSAVYQFDDGTTTQMTNQCVARTTGSHVYFVKICNDVEFCNAACANSDLYPPVQPAPGPVSTRTCSMCESHNGMECTGGYCQGIYCFYKRTLIGRQLSVEKGCSNTAQILVDDKTLFDADLNQCQTLTASPATLSISQTTLKICNDGERCNEYCSHPQVVYTDQRRTRPTVRCLHCSADGANDCTGSYCEGSYCVYEYKLLRDGTRRVVRGCSNQPQIEFPDNQVSRTINECESHTTADGNRYLVEICNERDFCATKCLNPTVLTTSPQPLREPQVTCYSCETAINSDCRTGSCRGNYCYYRQVYNSITRTATVTRGCSAETDLSDKFRGESWPQAYRSCEVRTQSPLTYSVSVCNNGNYCESRCSNPYLPQASTASPWIGDDAANSLSITLIISFVTTALLLA